MTDLLEKPPAQARRVREFPVWLSAVIIVAALAGGAGIVYWYFKSGPAGDTVVLDRGPQDGVTTLSPDKNWRVISGNSVLRVTRDRGGQLNATFDFLHYDFLAPDEFTLLNNGRRLAIDSAMAGELGLNDQQVAKVRDGVRHGFRIDISDADRQRLLALFNDYLQASDGSRESRETALLRAMEEVGDRTAARAHQVGADAAAQIKAALTPEQWRKFDQMGQ